MEKMNYYDGSMHYTRVLFNSLKFLINDVLEGLTLEAFFGLFILNILLIAILSNILKLYALVIFILISGIICIVVL